MKYTDDEIKQKITAVFNKYEKLPEAPYWYNGGQNIDVKANEDTFILVKVSAMYGAPPLNSTTVQLLCEAFGTKHIDETNQWSEGGCETCDYGSSYGWEIRIKLPSWSDSA